MDGRGPSASHAARIVIRPEDLQGAARLLTRVSDPRAAVCLAASWMLRADVAELWEPSSDGPTQAPSSEPPSSSAPPADPSTPADPATPSSSAPGEASTSPSPSESTPSATADESASPRESVSHGTR